MIPVFRMPKKKIPIRESLFYGKSENWDQMTPSNSPRARGTEEKFGKERVHREELSRSGSLMSAVLAPKFGERSHAETLHQERCARRVAWDLAKHLYKLKNSAKATFYCPVEIKAVPAPISNSPEERDLVVASVNRTPTHTACTDAHSALAHHTAQSDHFSSREHAWLKIAHLCVPKHSVIHASCLVPCRT